MITEFEVSGLLDTLQGKLLMQRVHCVTLGVNEWAPGVLRAPEFVCNMPTGQRELGLSLYSPRGLHPKK